MSALCRELSLNRQQFARYLSGESRPSPFNRRRIAIHFQIPVEDLALPHAQFLARHDRSGDVVADGITHPVSHALDAPADSLELLRKYTGYYWSYLQSPSNPSQLLKSLVQLHVESGRFVSIWEGSFSRIEDGSVQTSRYEGVGRLRNGYLFIVDIDTISGDSILETILRVPQGRRTDILTGMTLGMTTGWHRMPFASVVVFKYLGKRIDWNAIRKQRGFHDLQSRNVEPNVRNVFAHQSASHIYPQVFEKFLM